jgi:hypothetical protein
MTLVRLKESAIIAALCAFTAMCLIATVMIFNVGTATPELTATMSSKMDQEFDFLNGRLSSTLDKTNLVLDRVNRPCFGAGFQKMDNCGTLSLAGQLMVKGSDILVTTQHNENVEAQLLNQTLPDLTTHLTSSLANFDHASAQMQPLLLAATARVNDLAPFESHLSALTADLDTTTVTTTQRFNTTMDHVNGMLVDPAVHTTMTNFASMTTTGNHMLFTADQVETKLARCTLTPTFSCRFRSNLILGAQVGGYLLH